MKKVFILIVSALILGLFFTGCEDIAKITSPATVNTDGDLYKCICVQSDTATGMGTPIKTKGTWFMYNHYIDPYPGDDGWESEHFPIQAGNPKNGLNYIGNFWVSDLGYGWYRVGYGLFSDTFEVVDEHLAISDTINFTAAPGKDDNMDFMEEFYDKDGKFYIFAHFAVECAK